MGYPIIQGVPKYQGICGSCYAHAAATIYEAYLCANYNKCESLSANLVASCNPQKGSAVNTIDGCLGGNPILTLHYLRQGITVQEQNMFSGTHKVNKTYEDIIGIRVVRDGWKFKTIKDVVTKTKLVDVPNNPMCVLEDGIEVLSNNIAKCNSANIGLYKSTDGVNKVSIFTIPDLRINSFPQCRDDDDEEEKRKFNIGSGHSFKRAMCEAKAKIQNDIDINKKIKEYIYKFGPAMVKIDASQMQFYSGGTLENSTICTAEPTHSVVIVGWQLDEGGDEVWIIRNSWSPFWGDEGYLYVKTIGSICNIESSPVFMSNFVDAPADRIPMTLDNSKWFTTAGSTKYAR